MMAARIRAEQQGVWISGPGCLDALRFKCLAQASAQTWSPKRLARQATKRLKLTSKQIQTNPNIASKPRSAPNTHGWGSIGGPSDFSSRELQSRLLLPRSREASGGSLGRGESINGLHKAKGYFKVITAGIP